MYIHQRVKIMSIMIAVMFLDFEWGVQYEV